MPKLFGSLLLSAGAMKAGTTWLFSVLARHPDLYVTPEKELHYFYHRYVDNGLLNERRRLSEAKQRYLARFDPEKANIDRVRQNVHWVTQYLSNPVDDFWYRGLFAQMRPHHRYGCDFSNLYAHLPPQAWSRIAAECDKLRVIYTMRDPVKRLWSHVKFQLQLDNRLDCLDTWSPSEMENFARQDHICRNGEYGTILNRMQASLAPEQLKVLQFENLRQDPRHELAEIEKFLNLSPFNYPEAVLSRQVNPSRSHPMPAYFADLFAKDVERIQNEVAALGIKMNAIGRSV